MYRRRCRKARVGREKKHKIAKRTKALDILAEHERHERGGAEQTDNQIHKLVDDHAPQRRRVLLLELVRAERGETRLGLGRRQALE